jgi:hypothetical protein
MVEFARKWWNSPENGEIRPKMVKFARKVWNLAENIIYVQTPIGEL